MKSALRFVTFVLLLVVGGSWNLAAQQAKKEFELRGKVEQVDSKDKRVTVNHEKVEGWMAAMTMKYKVDKDDVLQSLKPGDQITAKVKEGDFETLYNVQRVPAGDSGSSSKK